MHHATIVLDLPVALSLIPTLVGVLPCRVAAGFPSQADNHAVQRVELPFFRTSPFRTQDLQYSRSTVVSIWRHTTDRDGLALVRA